MEGVTSYLGSQWGFQALVPGSGEAGSCMRHFPYPKVW